jgi:hypothetical protein
MILSWDKPVKKAPVEEHQSWSFDGGPPGGYVPNMSEEDSKKWKAKLTGQKKGFPQVEIRRTVTGSQLLIIVNLGKGYTYKYLKPDVDSWGRSTQGFNVHMSMNGPIQMTFEDISELNEAIEEAKEFLENLPK